MPVTETVHPLVTLRNQLEKRSDEFKHALPANIPVDRFTRVTLTAIQVNPDLLAANRQSLWNALMRAASDGLIPDGREAALVVFKDTVQYLPMIGGILKRFRNSGHFRSITANIVRESEPFRYWIDEHGEHLNHEPGDGTGKAIKAYALAELVNGGVMVKVMSSAEIEKRRNVSRAKNSPLWTEWTDEAWLKTVLRNLAKRLPSSSDIDELMHRDDDDDAFETKPNNPNLKPITNVSGALDAFSAPKEELEPSLPTLEPEEKEPWQTDEQAAFEEGVEARASGISRKAVPPEYRTPEKEALARAWQFGWDKK